MRKSILGLALCATLALALATPPTARASPSAVSGQSYFVTIISKKSQIGATVPANINGQIVVSLLLGAAIEPITSVIRVGELSGLIDKVAGLETTTAPEPGGDITNACSPQAPPSTS